MKPTTLASLAALALGAGCAGSTPRPAPPPPPAPARAAATDAELARLLLGAGEHHACEALRGMFFPLLPPDAPRGPEVGRAPVTGRWWIRECEARREGDALRVRLVGPLWQWTAQEQQGFRLRQYVHLAADVTVRGRVDLAYDADRGLATLWFSPVRRPDARVRVLGDVDPRAASFLTRAGNVLTLGLLDEVADERAEAEAGPTGARQMEGQLGVGVTVVLDVPRGQQYVVPVPLAEGARPEVPLPTEARWVVNETQAFYPGGLGFHVSGPHPRALAAHLDVQVQRGDGVRYRAVCEDDARRAFEPLAAGRAPELPQALPGQEGEVRGEALATRALAVPGCRWYLVTAPVGDEHTRAAVRLRARAAGALEEAPLPDAAPAPPAATAPRSPTPRAPAPAARSRP